MYTTEVRRGAGQETVRPASWPLKREKTNTERLPKILPSNTRPNDSPTFQLVFLKTRRCQEHRTFGRLEMFVIEIFKRNLKALDPLATNVDTNLPACNWYEREAQTRGSILTFP